MFLNLRGMKVLKPFCSVPGSRSRRMWSMRCSYFSICPYSIVALECNPSLCAVSCISSHPSAFTLSAQIFSLISGWNISAPPPGIESSPHWSKTVILLPHLLSLCGTYNHTHCGKSFNVQSGPVRFDCFKQFCKKAVVHLWVYTSQYALRWWVCHHTVLPCAAFVQCWVPILLPVWHRDGCNQKLQLKTQTLVGSIWKLRLKKTLSPCSFSFI